MVRREVIRSQRHPVAVGTSAPVGWGWLLVFTAGYMVMAVARVHEFIPPLTRVRPMLIVTAFATVLYLLDRQRRRSINFRHPLVMLAGFIIVWATVTAPLGLYLGGSVRFLFDELYKVGLLFLLIAAAVRDARDVRRLLVVYVYGCGALGAYLLATSRESTGGYDPNDVAMVLASAVPPAIHLLIHVRRRIDRLPLLFALSMSVVGVVMTGSRAGFVTLAAAIGFSLFFFRGIKKSWRIATVVGIVGLVGVVAGQAYWSEMSTLTSLGEDYNVTSFTGRKQIWLRGIGYMTAHPITGVGIDNFQAAEGRNPVAQQRLRQGRGTKWSAAHSAWIQVGAELGLPGLIAFVLLFGVAAKRLYRIRRLGRRRDLPAGAREVPALAEALLGTLFALAVGISFLSQAYGYAVWAVLGLALGLFKVARANGLEVAPRGGLRRRRKAGWQLAPQG